MNFFENRPEFETRSGDIFRYVSHGNKKLCCWEVVNQATYEGNYNLRIIPVTDIAQTELQNLGIWDEINPETQGIIVRMDTNGEKEIERELKKEQEFEDKLKRREREKKGLPEEKPKRTRRSLDEFKDYPEFLVCKCGSETKANYSYLSKKAEKEGVTVMDLVNGYVCQTCNPTMGRGRQPNPEYADLPEFLECKCGHKVKANYSQLARKADKMAVTLKRLVETYQCQTCNPTKGRPKKS